MFDALIHGENGEIASASQTAAIVERLEIADDRERTIRLEPDTIDEVRPGQMQSIPRDGADGVVEERARIRANLLNDGVDHASRLVISVTPAITDRSDRRIAGDDAISVKACSFPASCCDPSRAWAASAPFSPPVFSRVLAASVCSAARASWLRRRSPRALPAAWTRSYLACRSFR